MKKVLMLFFMLFALVILGLSSYAVNSNAVLDDKYLQKISSGIFQTTVQQFNSLLGNITKDLNTTNVSYDTIINKIKYTTINRGVYDVKYIKLSNMCRPVPANLKTVPANACAKLIIDTNGFNNQPNKLFREKLDVRFKDQYIVYLYSNGVRAEYNSPEDLLLYAGNNNN